MKVKILIGLQKFLGFALILIGLIIVSNFNIMQSWRYFMALLALVLGFFLMPFAFIFGLVFLFSNEIIIFNTKSNNIEPTPTAMSQNNYLSNYNYTVKQKVEVPLIIEKSVVSKLESKTHNDELIKKEKYFENYSKKNYYRPDDVEDYNRPDDVEDYYNLANTPIERGFDTEFGYVDLDFLKEEMENEKNLAEFDFFENIKNKEIHPADLIDDPYDED